MWASFHINRRHRQTGGNQAQGLLRIHIRTRKIRRGETTGGPQNKAAGGRVKQSDRAGIDLQEPGQTYNNGLHYLPMIMDHRDHLRHLLEDLQILPISGL